MPPLESVQTPELVARIRAAWAYSRLDQKVLAKQAGIDEERMRRLLRRTGSTRPDPQELLAIADACQVPHAFMETGFAVLETASDEPSPAELAADLHEVRLRLSALELASRRRSAEATNPGRHPVPGQQPR